MEIDFFLLGLTLIFLHEMDAIRCREWRIFPGLSFLNDQWGLIAFTFAHIPLIYWIFLEVQSGSERFRDYFSIFLIVHLLLHLLFLMHKKNEFKDWISWTIIAGAAICGAIELLLN
ncbi:MAG: hypothetical protein MRZ79_13800 [Bacteroidia bacterium]|nr:hypothetical protein [Bacteroidia bacterium]